jgi:hypothetical protein
LFEGIKNVISRKEICKNQKWTFLVCPKLKFASKVLKNSVFYAVLEHKALVEFSQFIPREHKIGCIILCFYWKRV